MEAVVAANMLPALVEDQDVSLRTNVHKVQEVLHEEPSKMSKKKEKRFDVPPALHGLGAQERHSVLVALGEDQMPGLSQAHNNSFI